MAGEKGTDKFVLVPRDEEAGEGCEGTRHQAGSFCIPEELFPGEFRVCRLAGGEAFLEECVAEIPQDEPVTVFLFPPILSGRMLSDRLRTQHPRMGLSEIVLTRVVERLAPGSMVGALLPAAFFFTESLQTARRYLSQIASVRLIVDHDHPADVFFGLPVHNQFRMGTVFLHKVSERTTEIRFFKCPLISTESEREEVVSDLRRLLQRKGGKSHHGFVLREGLGHGASWHFDLYHPDLAKRMADLEHLGEMRTLGDLVDIWRGLDPQMDRNSLVEGTEARGIPVIEGRDIKIDGTVDCRDTRYRALNSEDRQLRVGDICVRSIQGAQSRIVCGVVNEDTEAATAGRSVIVLRPRPEISVQEREFLVAYLRSSACTEFMKSHGPGIQILPRKLLELSVPIADEALQLAVENLNDAAKNFRVWAEELETARGSLFDSQSARNARITALAAGRLGKQRFEAAALVSDFRQRVRTRFPYPMAFRWRSVESEHPTLEGYVQVLECAEVVITYLATMALLLAQSEKKEIRWLRTMAERFSTKGHGTNMGDWLSILQEAGGANFADDIPETAPFVEVLRLQGDTKVKQCLERLSKLRNDQAHGRGPKGAAVAEAFNNAKTALVTLLESVEFVADYPLRYIETTRRDSLLQVTKYDYRELMGDHALVPIACAETQEVEIEADSLYLMDRVGRLHLLRPFLTGRECPVCHSWGTFFLDSCGKGGGSVTLKSMEHGHPLEDVGLAAAFRHRGMIR